MNASYLSEFIQLLNQLSQIYHASLTPEVIELYWQILSPHDIRHIRWACAQHLQDTVRGQYFPKPADILYWLKPDKHLQATQAWRQLFQAIARYGAYQPVIFEDQCLHAAVQDLGGWVYCCRQTARQLDFLRPVFLQTYQRYLQHPPEAALFALDSLMPGKIIRIAKAVAREEITHDA